MISYTQRPTARGCRIGRGGHGILASHVDPLRRVPAWSGVGLAALLLPAFRRYDERHAEHGAAVASTKPAVE